MRPTKYINIIENSINENDVIFIDNIFLGLSAYFQPQDRIYLKQNLQNSTIVNSFIDDKIRKKELQLLPEIHKQALLCYTTTKRLINNKKKIIKFNNEEEEYLIKYFENFYSLLIHKGGLYYPDLYYKYNNLLEKLIKLETEKKIRKDNHKEDNFTDGKLVATAFYEALEGKYTAIITKDYDIFKLSEYLNLEIKNKSRGRVIVYNLNGRYNITSYKIKKY